jgi:hypothetical protein
MRSLGVVVVCSIVCAACHTTPPPAGTPDTGPLPDAYRSDAGRDSASDVGPPEDTANDTTNDSAVDAFADDGGFMPGACVFDATMDLFDIDVDPRSRPTRVATAGGPSAFGIVYSKVGADAFENVYFQELGTHVGDTMPVPRQLTFDIATTTTPAVTRTETGWLLAWASNRPGTMEIFTLGSGSDGRLLSTPTRITTNVVQDQAPMLASTSAGTALVWTELDGTGGHPSLAAQLVNADGTTSGSIGHTMPTGFTIRPQVFTSTDTGYLVAWSDPSLNAVVLPLGTDATSTGTPASLTSVPDSDGSFDAVVSNGGGVAVFGADLGSGRREVHAHPLDATGAPFDVERVLTIGTDNGTDASIAELGGGYVVAYRQAGTPPMLRVLFLDSLLNEVARRDLVGVASTGGPTSVHVSGDGAVLITWADVVGSETHLRAARIRCP